MRHALEDEKRPLHRVEKPPRRVRAVAGDELRLLQHIDLESR